MPGRSKKSKQTNTPSTQTSKPKKKQIYSLRCERCRYVFANKGCLERHQQNLGIDCVGFVYACKRCFKIFNDIDKLYKHQLSETSCPKFEFKNQLKPKDRISIMFAIGEKGFHEIITETLTPQPYDLNNPEETKLNTDLIKLLFNSLSCDEFVELIKLVTFEIPNLKFQLMAALKIFNEEAPDDKAQKIKEYFQHVRSTSFD